MATIITKACSQYMGSVIATACRRFSQHNTSSFIKELKKVVSDHEQTKAPYHYTVAIFKQIAQRQAATNGYESWISALESRCCSAKELVDRLPETSTIAKVDRFSKTVR